MKIASLVTPSVSASRRRAFSLIEVVLAIGIFLITVLALVGLLGPTLQSVDEVEKTDEVASVVNTLNAFLQSSPEIANRDGVGNITESKFSAIYNAVYDDGAATGHATVLVFRQYNNDDSISLKVGFVAETNARVADSDITSGGQVLAAGPIYRAVLTPSSVIPDAYIKAIVDEDNPNATQYPAYQLNQTLENYPEGYFAMEVRIYAEEPNDGFVLDRTTADLRDKAEPIFTYNTAVVR